MIQFSLSLSVNQIAVLRAIRARTDDDDPKPMMGITHWIVGLRPLHAEKLIYRSADDKETHITEKGRLVLRLIEMDIADAAQEIGERQMRMLSGEGKRKDKKLK